MYVTKNHAPLVIGDFVQKIHVHDGSPDAGNPEGEILRVVNIKDHRPIDGPHSVGACIELSDDSMEFIWNLWKVHWM